jgi:YbbR domain-containing protein
VSMPAINSPIRQVASATRLTAVELKRKWSLGPLRERMRRNSGLRIISLLLALGLWLFVNAGEHGSQISLQVPVSYRGLAPGYVIVNPHPDSVKIRLSGPRTLLSLTDPGRLRLRLDLTGAGVGQTSFKISPDSFSVLRQTSVESVSPSQIVLEIDRIVTREVPVRLVLTGKAAAGYKVEATEVAPATVTIRGPSKELARVEQLETEPLDVSGLGADLTRSVTLDQPNGMLRVQPEEVTVKVTVTAAITTREFHDVPVLVRDSDFKFKVAPTHVSVTLRGSALTLAKLNLAGSVYVEADGLTPGLHTPAVQMALPEGVEIVRQSPQKVKLRMYRERQPAVEYHAQ